MKYQGFKAALRLYSKFKSSLETSSQKNIKYTKEEERRIEESKGGGRKEGYHAFISSALKH